MNRPRFDNLTTDTLYCLLCIAAVAALIWAATPTGVMA